LQELAATVDRLEDDNENLRKQIKEQLEILEKYQAEAREVERKLEDASTERSELKDLVASQGIKLTE
jgi:predicted RNase H-like nuclease (RuvC/YqgF family)